MPYSHPFDESVFISYWNYTAAPAAGAGASISLPAAAQMELCLLSFSLNADANAANRNVYITLETGGQSIVLSGSDLPQTANLNFRYLCHQNAPFAFTAGSFQLNLPLPNLRIFDNTATVDINITNVQAGDQLSAIFAYWKLWRGVG